MVDAGFVGQEALVHKEHSGDRTVGENFLCHGLCACRAVCFTVAAHTVSGRRIVFVPFPSSAVVDAFVSALWGRHVLVGACRVLRAIDVVGTRGELVRVAHRLIAVVAASDYAIEFHVRPSALRDPTIATIISVDVTGCHILR